MEFFDLVKKRRSVRKYSGESISRGDIMRVLDAANHAPSAMNRQPWEFLVVTGAKIGEVGECYGRALAEIAGKMKAAGEKSMITTDDFIRKASGFGGAPALILVLAERPAATGEMKAHIESASAAMENLLLAATDLGLGTCWMTGPLRQETEIRKILEIGDDREIVALTPLGHPDENPERMERRDPELKRKIRWIE
jgi:nitroreductase